MITPEVIDSITIDGHAGAGKSTLGEIIADRTEFVFFDTGVMYRVVTEAALRKGVDVRDESAVGELAENLNLRILPATVKDGRQNTIMLEDDDITWDIRSPRVEANVSVAAKHPTIRTVLRGKQRDIGIKGKVVMVGRDIGTIVLPEARLKLYLTASTHARAERRLRDLEGRGQKVDLAQLEADIAARDLLDQHVMSPALDAIHLDSSQLTIPKEVDLVMRKWAERISPIDLRRTR